MIDELKLYPLLVSTFMVLKLLTKLRLLQERHTNPPGQNPNPAGRGNKGGDTQLNQIIDAIGVEPYYREDAGVIYNADCMDILPKMPEKCVDLVVTDPPYIVGAKGCGLAGDRAYLHEITDRNLDQGFDSNILDGFNNWFCFCGKQQLLDILRRAQSSNWMLITWCKTNPTPLTNNNYLPDCEYIIHKYAKGRLFGKYSDKSRFIITNNASNSIPHPTVKPLPIVEKCINLGSEANDLIFDPFLGSGTTAVAAKQLGRKYIGIEIEKKYCDIAVQRLAQEILL